MATTAPAKTTMSGLTTVRADIARACRDAGRDIADVELVAVPSDWGPSLTKYRYVYSNDRVLLVDPGSRAVVQEID